jgi:opacity protein-like surface antigen
VVIIGGTFELSDKIFLNLEYRYSYCRVELTDLGYMQAGGNAFFIGISYAFPPADKRLK